MNTIFLAPLLLANLATTTDCSVSLEQLWALNEPSKVSFTETENTDQRIRVARFDADAPDGQKWHLLSIDGVPPDKDEAREFLAGKSSSENSVSMREMIMTIDRQSIEPVMVSDGETVYQFHPLPESEEEKEFIEDLAGQLVVRTDQRCEILMKRFNTAPISPAMGVKLEQFSITTRFRPHLPGGWLFPVEFDVQIKGRAFVFKKFEQNTIVTLTDVTLAP
jgi:hypothetical protein